MKKCIAFAIIQIFWLGAVFGQSDTTTATDGESYIVYIGDLSNKAVRDSALMAADSLQRAAMEANARSASDLVPGKVLYGIASFYSRSLDGTETSTGEIFRQNKMTAASNNFDLNTWVRVTNLRNGKSVIVRINDHMAKRMAKKGRVVDLSHKAAAKLDFLILGITRVKVEEVPEGTTE